MPFVVPELLREKETLGTVVNVENVPLIEMMEQKESGMSPPLQPSPMLPLLSPQPQPCPEQLLSPLPPPLPPLPPSYEESLEWLIATEKKKKCKKTVTYNEIVEVITLSDSEDDDDEPFPSPSPPDLRSMMISPVLVSLRTNEEGKEWRSPPMSVEEITLSSPSSESSVVDEIIPDEMDEVRNVNIPEVEETVADSERSEMRSGGRNER